MTWAIAWPFVKKFGPLVLLAVALFGLYQLGRSHGGAKWRGKHDIAIEERNTARGERDTAVKERDIALHAVAISNEATAKLERDSDRRVAHLEAELSKKPEVITKYKDRVEVVEKVIQSEDCATAVLETAEVLGEVPPP